jgi:hypothetical protein
MGAQRWKCRGVLIKHAAVVGAQLGERCAVGDPPVATPAALDT